MSEEEERSDGKLSATKQPKLEEGGGEKYQLLYNVLPLQPRQSDGIVSSSSDTTRNKPDKKTTRLKRKKSNKKPIHTAPNIKRKGKYRGLKPKSYPIILHRQRFKNNKITILSKKRIAERKKFILIGLIGRSVYFLSCKNHFGKNTTWSITLKSPGKNYHYYDNILYKRRSNMMQFHDNILKSDTALKLTLDQYHKAKNDGDKITLRLAYNDSEPDSKTEEEKLQAKIKMKQDKRSKKRDKRSKKNDKRSKDQDKDGKTNSKNGHMKGIILFRNGHGIWITHSCPKLPHLRENCFPQNALKHGQHIVCMNINYRMLKILIEHLYHSHPNIYDHHIPEKYKHIEMLNEVTGNTFSKNDTECLSDCNLSTTDKIPFDLHSKSDACSVIRETWSSLWDEIADIYKQTFDVQTWYRGDRDLCENPVHKIQDIGYISVRNGIPGGTVTWRTRKDHSKYGFSHDGEKLCFSDLNHTITITDRGGSFLCFHDSFLVTVVQNTFEYHLKTVVDDDDESLYGFPSP